VTVRILRGDATERTVEVRVGDPAHIVTGLDYLQGYTAAAEDEGRLALQHFMPGDDVVLTLPHSVGGQVTGQVTVQAWPGQPLPGVALSFIDLSSGAAVPVGVTGSDGKAILPDIGRPGVGLLLFHPEHGIHLLGPGQRKILHVWHRAPLPMRTVAAVDPLGEDLKTTAIWSLEGIRRTVHARDGALTVQAVPTSNLRIGADGYEARNVPHEALRGSTGPVRVVLEPRGPVATLRIRGNDRAPLHGAVVEVVRASARNMETLARFVTDDGGRIEAPLDILERGNVLVVEARTWRPRVLEYSHVPVKEIGLERAGPAVLARLTGERFAGTLSITVTTAQGHPAWARSYPVEGGTVELADLPRGPKACAWRVPGVGEVARTRFDAESEVRLTGTRDWVDLQVALHSTAFDGSRLSASFAGGTAHASVHDGVATLRLPERVGAIDLDLDWPPGVPKTRKEVPSTNPAVIVWEPQGDAMEWLPSVVDDGGRPVDGAVLWVAGEGREHARPLREGKPLLLPASGRCSLAVRAPGRVDWRRDFRGVEGDPPSRIVLPRYRHLTVEVQGVGDAEVILHTVGPRGHSKTRLGREHTGVVLVDPRWDVFMVWAQAGATVSGIASLSGDTPQEDLVLGLEPVKRTYLDLRRFGEETLRAPLSIVVELPRLGLGRPLRGNWQFLPLTEITRFRLPADARLIDLGVLPQGFVRVRIEYEGGEVVTPQTDARSGLISVPAER